MERECWRLKYVLTSCGTVKYCEKADVFSAETGCKGFFMVEKSHCNYCLKHHGLCKLDSEWKVVVAFLSLYNY